MRRRLAAILAAAATLAALSGCAIFDLGAPEPTPQASDACTVENPCEIRYRWWGDADTHTIQHDAVAAFEAAHPGITVLATPVPAEDYMTLLAVELAAHNPPDVVMLDPDNTLFIGTQGGVRDLTTYGVTDATTGAVTAANLALFATTANLGEPGDPSSTPAPGAIFGLALGFDDSGLMTRFVSVTTSSSYPEAATTLATFLAEHATHTTTEFIPAVD